MLAESTISIPVIPLIGGAVVTAVGLGVYAARNWIKSHKWEIFGIGTSVIVISVVPLATIYSISADFHTAFDNNERWESLYFKMKEQPTEKMKMTVLEVFLERYGETQPKLSQKGTQKIREAFKYGGDVGCKNRDRAEEMLAPFTDFSVKFDFEE